MLFFNFTMRLLVGIIVSDNDEYQVKAQKVWKKYMNKNENIKSYFLKINNSKPDLNFDQETFSCQSEFENENTHNMVIKTLKFMQVMLQKDTWDHMLRTNLLSVFKWDTVLSLLNQNQC